MSRTSLERKSKSKKAAFVRCFFCAGTDKLTVHFHIPHLNIIIKNVLQKIRRTFKFIRVT